MDNLEKFKKEYNKKLERRKNAEEYFKTHTVDQCIKYLDLFNTVTSELGELIKEYKQLTGKNMLKKQILNGFDEEV